VTLIIPMHFLRRYVVQLGRVLLLSLTSILLFSAYAQEVDHAHPSDPALSQSGQAAFASIQEIVARLEADPATDWSKVDIDRLRNHLIDMDEVMMHADSNVQDVEGGVRISVTGSGRTLAAIQRMIPAPAAMMNEYRGWHGVTEPIQNGIAWTLFTSTPSERTRIRGLGLFGLLTLGSHHGPHHMAMAKGEPLHGHHQ
jgi:hypothetical protein